MRNSVLMATMMAMLVWDVPVQAQSGDPYVFLRNAASGYAEVLSGHKLDFPRDYGAHPEFRIEWWYVTANLQDIDGSHYGVQWTLFRQSLSPQISTIDEQGGEKLDWGSNQVWLAHAAITNQKLHRHWQKMARGGIGQAGVDAQPFSAWIDHWALGTSLSSRSNDLYPLDLRFSINDNGEYAANLQLTAGTPMVLNGLDGYSQKSASGQASYYYSQPHLEVSGQIVWQGEPVMVTGQAWLDREWSSQPLAENQSGWDWFSLHLDDGRALMLYQMREIGDKNKDEYRVSGSLVAKNGSKINILQDEVQLEVLTTKTLDNRTLPLRWRISIPKYDIDLTIEPLHDQQFISGILPYWEGVIFAFDSKDYSLLRRQVGRGYMELMGYN